jgi:hypothetical protein
MADGLTPEQVEATLDHAAAAAPDDNEGDWLMQLFGGGRALRRLHPRPAAPAPQQPDHIDEPASLFDSDYHYAKTALTQLNQGQTLCQWAPDDAEQHHRADRAARPARAPAPAAA